MAVYEQLIVVAQCPDGGSFMIIKKEHFEEKYGAYEPFMVALYVARAAALHTWARSAPIRVYAVNPADGGQPIAVYRFTYMQLTRPHWSIPSYHPHAKDYNAEDEWDYDADVRAAQIEEIEQPRLPGWVKGEE